jgi:hypothetical protein
MTLRVLQADGELVLRGTVTDFTNDNGDVALTRALP